MSHSEPARIAASAASIWRSSKRSRRTCVTRCDCCGAIRRSPSPPSPRSRSASASTPRSSPSPTACSGVRCRIPLPIASSSISSAQQTETGVKTFGTWAPVSYEGLRPRVTTLDASRGLQLDRRGAHRTRRAAAGAGARRESEFLRHAGRQPRARPRVPHRRRGARRRPQRDRQRSAVAHVAQGRSGDRRTVHHHRRPPPHRRRRAAAGLQLQAGDPDRRAAGSGHLSAQSLARRHRHERVSLPAGPHEARRDAGTRGSGTDGAGERSVDRARRRARASRRVRGERPHARAHGRLAGVRHGVGAHAAADPARGGVVRAADRLRQRREPADGAPHRAPRRAVRAHGPRRGTPADRASAADRSGRAVAAGRGARRDARADRDRTSRCRSCRKPRCRASAAS